LIVSGLAGTSRDVAALTRDGAHTYTMAGAMGGACMIGLGLALARPDRRVLVVTGDGELLMNVGALAIIAVMNPANLTIVCVDNGHYGETGYQKSHTSLGVDLEKIAAGSGIEATRTIASQEELADGARLLRQGNGTAFVVLRVKPTDPPAFERDMEPSACRSRFRAALLGPLIPRVISGVALHRLEHRCRRAGCFVILAPLAAPHLDHLLLYCEGFGSVSFLPQDRGEITHRRQTIGMVLAVFAAGGGEHRCEQFPSAGEIALRCDRSGEVVDGAEGFEIGVAEQRAASSNHLLLKLPRLFQIPLGCQGHGQFSDGL
jgi:phosphonopyruvate decarboxylase